MRFTCSQKELISALNIVSKAVATNNTLPVLNNVLIKAEDKVVYFTGTNLELAIHYWVEGEVKEGGEITIPAKLLTSYVGYLKESDLDFEVQEGYTVLLKTPHSKTKIKGIASTEFPTIPTVDQEGGFTVSLKDLSKAIEQVVFAAALNTTRPILTGVYLGLEEGKLKMVATDSYRLAEKTLEVSEIQEGVSCVVPARTLMELNSIFGFIQGVDKVQVTISKNQILFSVGRLQITSRLIEGQFPNYKQVIPTEKKTRIRLKSTDLSLVLKRINLFAKENNNKILFKLEDTQLYITTETTQYGVGEEVLTVEREGEGNEIALNSQFMLDVLSNIKSEEVDIELDNKARPAVFKSAHRDDYIHIIMPLKM